MYLSNILNCIFLNFKIKLSKVAVNKQLADKERVAAALENSHLLTVVNQCLDTGARPG